MTQNSQILQHLKEKGPLTPLEALSLYGCLRLGARMFDLKREGYNIISRMVELPSGKWVAQYSLYKETQKVFV